MTPMMTIRQIAKAAGVAPKTIYAWRKAGIDVYDPAALRARIDQKPLRVTDRVTLPAERSDAPQATPDASGESYAEARRRREIANANVAEIEERKMRGELIEAADISRQGDAIGRAVRRELESLAAQLPARLGGRTSAEIAEILHEETRRILNELSDRSELFNPEPSNQ